MLMLLLLLNTGCQNACQQLCGDIQDYAKECGYDFTSEQLRQCVKDHKRSELEKGAPADCRQTAPNIRDEWTCDDFEDYFNATQPADDTDE